MDNMLKKLEKYSCNLEELVEHRTSELVEEKKKTDILLILLILVPGFPSGIGRIFLDQDSAQKSTVGD